MAAYRSFLTRIFFPARGASRPKVAFMGWKLRFALAT